MQCVQENYCSVCIGILLFSVYRKIIVQCVLFSVYRKIIVQCVQANYCSHHVMDTVPEEG